MKSFTTITTSLESYIESAEARLERCRKALIQKIAEGCEMRHVTSSIIDVAKEEGKLGAAYRLKWEFARYVEEGVMEAVTDLATEPADDTWSGRGNDVMRAMHDGRMETVKHIKDSLF